MFRRKAAEPLVWTPDPETFRVLTVCTGNICRSPMAERLLTAKLLATLPAGQAARVAVRSAGVLGLSGQPMDPDAAAVTRERGGDPMGFVARRVDPEILAAADLVLTATRAHRVALVRQDPAVAGRVYTLKQFARLLAGVTATGERDVVVRGHAAVAYAREHVRAVDPDTDVDLADPYQLTYDAFVRCADRVEDALAPLVTVLT